MGQALYRQYRPKSLDEVKGQEHITATLKKAITSNQLSHAYLLTGPRGVGKTTVARILAHAVNKLDYSDDSAHLDIIEIDAASNRRIDEIRELRERVYVTPSQLKYKVYIIDEVHMLTREAFNALLKTLEEPPEHVIFILATTDTHKLPETIISRTQHYSFKPISTSSTKERLAEIAKKEKINISDAALKLLAEHGDGSLRDSIGLLDQVKNHADSVNEDTVREILGLPPDNQLNQLIDGLQTSNTSPASLISHLNQLYGAGYQAGMLAHLISQKLRQSLIDGSLSASSSTLELLAELIEVPASSEPERLLEIVLLKNSQLAQQTTTAAVTISIPDAANKVTGKQVKSKKIEANTNDKDLPTDPKPISGSNKELWQTLLAEIKDRYNTLYGILRLADAEFNDESLMLTFAFPFHEKKISEAANRKIIEELAGKLSGRRLVLECRVDKSIATKPQDTHTPGQVTDSLSTISSIFNGAELLES